MDTDMDERVDSDLPSSRSQLLRHTFDSCLQHGLRSPDLQAFRHYFPHLQLPVVSALLDLYKQAEFADICDERDVGPRLAHIQGLCDQQQHELPTCSTGELGGRVAAAAQEHACVSAKQAELKYLQLALDQASSQLAALQEVQRQKCSRVAEADNAYSAAGQAMQQVYAAGAPAWFNGDSPSPQAGAPHTSGQDFSALLSRQS